VQVRREDQEKINRFSSLHQKETALEEELRGKLVGWFAFFLLGVGGAREGAGCAKGVGKVGLGDWCGTSADNSFLERER
jgi:hypothetical protein